MPRNLTGYTITMTLILIVAFVILGYVMFKDNKLRDRISNNNYKTACETNNGRWREKYKECEGISKDICERFEGEYKDCESPCRHDPDVEICTQVCISVCKFN